MIITSLLEKDRTLRYQSAPDLLAGWTSTKSAIRSQDAIARIPKALPSQRLGIEGSRR
jgi:hypothetical protein